MITSQIIGDCILPCMKTLINRSGRPMSIMIITLAQIIDATAIISEILVSGVAHFAFDSFKMELTRDPTRLTATKNTKFEI